MGSPKRNNRNKNGEARCPSVTSALGKVCDADYLRKIRGEKKVKKAVIIGGGLIGVETCEDLRLQQWQSTASLLLMILQMPTYHVLHHFR